MSKKLRDEIYEKANALDHEAVLWLAYDLLQLALSKVAGPKYGADKTPQDAVLEYRIMDAADTVGSIWGDVRAERTKREQECDSTLSTNP